MSTAVVGARHGDPFAVLGLHGTSEGLAIRAFVPGAASVEASTPTARVIAPLERVHADGFFEGLTPGKDARALSPCRVERHAAQWEFADPYAFAPMLGARTIIFSSKARISKLYERLGAHLLTP